MTILSILSAALLMWGAPAADPTSNQCVVAYLAAKAEKERLQGASYKNEPTESLLNFVANGRAVDYEARAAAVRKKHGASWTVREQAPLMEVAGLKSKFFTEGTMAPSEYYFAPETVFKKQREILGRLPACDRIYGFTPAVGPLPTHDAVLRHYADVAAKRSAADRAHRVSLDDTQCAVRYWVAANAGPDSPQKRQAGQAATFAAGKVLAANPAMTRERLLIVIQRQGMDIAQKLSSPNNVEQYKEDVRICTARYQVEIEQKKAAAPKP